MAYTIADVKTDLATVLKGATTDEITNILPLINRAGRQVLADVDPEETRRTESITNAIYDKIYDYQVPTDLKGKKVVDIRPFVNRDSKFTQVLTEDFDYNKENNTFNIFYNKGIRSLRLSKALNSGTVLSSCNSLTSEGTWTAGGDATNLTLDDLYYVSGSGALNFDWTATTSADVYITLITSVDLTDFEDIASVFAYVYIPDSTLITSFTLDWGSSASAYWSKTVTTSNNSAFHNGWNLLRFDWNGATKTGSPDSSAVDYVKLTITHTADAETDFRLDEIICTNGEIFEIDYYSSYLFKTTAGVWIEEATDDTDELNLDLDSYNLFLNKLAEFTCQSVRNDMTDAAYFKGEYDRGVINYQVNHPNESKQPINTYYTLFKR
jgi:hypothetical protein